MAQLGALAFYVAMGGSTQKAWPNVGLWLVKIHVNNINKGRGRRKRVTSKQEPVNVLSDAQGCTAT